MRVGNYASLMSAGDMSQSTLTSSILNATYASLFYIQATVTSAAGLTGTLKLQSRLKDQTNTGVVTNWADVPNSAQSVAANGEFVWEYHEPGADEYQVVWTKSGGSGTLNVNAKKKEIKA